jgi:DNA-binding transcriptional ArsR family regulator
MEERDDVFLAVTDYFAPRCQASRLKILYALCREEKSVMGVTGMAGLSQTNVSRHLNPLNNARTVDRGKSGVVSAV